MFPEAVALTEVLTDLDWRRHVAMVRRELDLDRFYQQVAGRLGQPKSYIATLATDHLPPTRPLRRSRYAPPRDSLAQWVMSHRNEHEKTRTEFWAEHIRTAATSTPFPEIRHFK